MIGAITRIMAGILKNHDVDIYTAFLTEYLRQQEGRVRMQWFPKLEGITRTRIRNSTHANLEERHLEN